MTAWLAGAKVEAGGIRFPGRPGWRAADVVLGPQEVVVCHRRAVARLTWEGDGSGWSLIPFAYGRGGQDIGMALWSEEPGAAAVLRSTRGLRNRLDQLFQVPRGIPLEARITDRLGGQAQFAVMSALTVALRDRGSWRAHLGDPQRAGALLADLQAWRGRAVHPPIGFRRSTVEVSGAIAAAGLVHPVAGRPLPGDEVRTAEEAIGDVLVRLRANRWVDQATVDEQQVAEAVHRAYLDVAPWPFQALVG